LIKEKLKILHLDDSLLKRAVNAGFSGGEKKRNEIFQMALLEPKLAILDETDSGLDIDALRVVADGVNALRSPERSMIVVTHYQRLLDYIEPDRVHVLAQGPHHPLGRQGAGAGARREGLRLDPRAGAGGMNSAVPSSFETWLSAAPDDERGPAQGSIGSKRNVARALRSSARAGRAQRQAGSLALHQSQATARAGVRPGRRHRHRAPAGRYRGVADPGPSTAIAS
jgi:energy-coupling factor transporter ATP-binding protein EcfA2